MKINELINEDWWNPFKKKDTYPQDARDAMDAVVASSTAKAAQSSGRGDGDTEVARRNAPPMPKQRPDVVQAAIARAAKDLGISPSALRAIVKTESNFKSTAVSPSGNHYGATQIHKSHFPMAGMTADEFKAASLDQQIAVYPEWAKSYRMLEKFPNIGTYKPAVQAAIMQAFQFAPNGSKWQKAFHSQNYDLPVTKSQQAGKLGTTSIRDMYTYFVGLGL